MKNSSLRCAQLVKLVLFVLFILCNIYSVTIDYEKMVSFAPENGGIRFAFTKKIGNSRHLFIGDTKLRECHQVTFDSSFQQGRAAVFVSYPAFTYDATRIIFYDRLSLSVYVIDSDGSCLRKIADGCRSSNTWRDPRDKSDWALIAEEGDDFLGPLYRLNIETGEKILLWKKNYVGKFDLELNCGLSKDGSMVVSNFPWPSKGIGVVPDGALTILPDGCWPGITSDDNVFHIIEHTYLTKSNLQGDTLLHTKVRTFFNDGPNDEDDWNYTNLRTTNSEKIITFHIEDNWPENKGFSIVSLEKRAIVHIETDALLGTAAVFHSDELSSQKKPYIYVNKTLQFYLSQPIDIPIYTRGNSILSSQDLHPGLQIKKVNNDCYVITGKISTVEKMWIRLRAENENGFFIDSTFVSIISPLKNAPSYKIECKQSASISTITNDYYKLKCAVVESSEVNIPVKFKWTVLSESKPIISSIFEPLTRVVFSTPGSYVFQLMVDDGNSQSFDTCNVTVNQEIPFKVLSPIAGQVLTVGANGVISWQIDPPTAVAIEISQNNGKKYKLLFKSAIGGQKKREDIVLHIDTSFQQSDSNIIKIYPYGRENQAVYSELFKIRSNNSAINLDTKKKFVYPSIQARYSNNILYIALNNNVDESVKFDIYSLSGSLIYSGVLKKGSQVLNRFPLKNIQGRLLIIKTKSESGLNDNSLKTIVF